MALPATLILLCIVGTLVGAANADCSKFTSCVDCVCSYPRFDASSPCLTTAKCGWCPSTSTCYSSPQESNSNCSDIVGAWQMPAGERPREAVGLCGVPQDPAALGVVVGMLCVAGLLYACNIYISCCRHRNRLVDAAWLRRIAVAGVPNGEPVEWEGCSEPVVVANATRCKAVWAVCVATVFVTLPPIVWLLVGLPNVVIKDASGFFILCSLGPLGILVWGIVTCGIKTTIHGYAISNQRVVEATAELGKQEQKAVYLHPITTIERLRVAGTSVRFWSGNTNIVIRHQQDTTQLYQYLQQRSASNQPPPAGAGAGAGAGADAMTTTLGAEPAAPVSVA